MIIKSTDPRANRRLGGKAESLLRLKKMGIAVPDFIVLDPACFVISDHNAENKSQAAAMKDSLLKHQLDSQLKKQILAHVRELGFPQRPLAVRSSARDEDGQIHAFAGMMDSQLNITTESQLWQAIINVAASGYNGRAIDYRLHQGLTLDVKIAVIIQLQVDAVVSGVLFSTYPTYPQEMAIHAIWGYGEGLVDGHVSPHEFYYLKDKHIPHRQVVEQQEIIFESAASGGLSQTDISTEKSKTACLNPSQGQQLYDLSQKLEKELKQPQDIEFVIDKEQLWIVQSRPITQVIKEPIIYDNSNIQESYCGVTTPLTYSFARRAYATVYRQTMKALGLRVAIIEENEPVINELLGLVYGRIYYNINNWYKGLLLLPKFKQNKSDMERMMGLTDPVDLVVDHKKNGLEKLSMLPTMLINLFRLLRAFSKLDQSILRFRKHFKTVFEHYYSLNLTEKTEIELKVLKTKLDDELLGNWDIPIINDFYVMMNNGKTVRNLRSLGITDVEEFQSRLFAGDHQMENTLPTKAMIDLAREARAQPELKETILSNDDISTAIRAEYPAFNQKVEDYIHLFGDRTVGELKLETQTMRVNQSVFYGYLKNYLRGEKLPTFQSGSKLRDAAMETLNEMLQSKFPWTRKSFHRNLSKLQKGIRNREALRMERTKLFGMYRDIYLQMGNRFCDKYGLSSPKDIFWLNEEEIWMPNELDLLDLVESRKTEFKSYENMEIPSRVVDPSPPMKATTEVTDKEALIGSTCYPGFAEGECVVVTRPDDNIDVSNKIIVALRTDPGWAALFPICKAVIIEKGSSLSHSVILLRELGIPSVINVRHLTKRIQTGDRIQLNAKTGEITPLDHV